MFDFSPNKSTMANLCRVVSAWSLKVCSQVHPEIVIPRGVDSGTIAVSPNFRQATHCKLPVSNATNQDSPLPYWQICWYAAILFCSLNVAPRNEKHCFPTMLPSLAMVQDGMLLDGWPDGLERMMAKGNIWMDGL